MKRKTKPKTRPLDPAEYLDTPEAIGAYLNDALASGSSADAVQRVLTALGVQLKVSVL